MFKKFALPTFCASVALSLFASVAHAKSEVVSRIDCEQFAFESSLNPDFDYQEELAYCEMSDHFGGYSTRAAMESKIIDLVGNEAYNFVYYVRFQGQYFVFAERA